MNQICAMSFAMRSNESRINHLVTTYATDLYSLPREYVLLMATISLENLG